MNRRILAIAWTLFFLFVSLGRSSLSAPPEQGPQKERQNTEKKKKNSTVNMDAEVPRGGVSGGIIGGTIENNIPGVSQGEVVGGSYGWNPDGADFMLEPVKIIRFNINHLLIKTTETVSLSTMTDWVTVSGLPIEYSYSGYEGGLGEVGVEITPKILEDKGIEIKISVLRQGKTIKEEKILTSNLGPVIVELMETGDNQIKIADKITPLIQTINPPQNYPQQLTELGIYSGLLIMNDTLIINEARGGMIRSDEASEVDPAFLFFWIKGKGLFVLSPWPFEEAKPIGVVSGNVIRIRHGDDSFAWYSSKPIVPEGKWRIWVRNNPDYIPTVGPFNSSTSPSPEDLEFMNRLNKAGAYAGVAEGTKSLDNFFPKK